MLDVVQISYHEEYADENFEILKMFAPFAKRVQGVKGIFAAHQAAAKVAETSHFYVIDADAKLVPGFNFDYLPGLFDTDKIHEVNLQLIITSSDKEILIKQGTPLAIYIPFKRQSYQLNIVDMNKNKKYIQRFKKYYVKLNGAFKYTVNKLKGTQ